MRTLPRTVLPLLAAFAPVFSRRVWRDARVPAAGVLLTPGKRAVAALRVAELSPIRRFERPVRALNGACWSGLAISRLMCRLLVIALVPDGPIVVGVDETIERRRGVTIAAKGIYRDAVRSRWSRFIQAWLVLGLLAAASSDPLGEAGLGAPVPDRLPLLGETGHGDHSAARGCRALHARATP